MTAIATVDVKRKVQSNTVSAKLFALSLASVSALRAVAIMIPVLSVMGKQTDSEVTAEREPLSRSPLWLNRQRVRHVEEK